MRTKIFYFSGTGNSLAVAKQVALRLDAEVFSIPKMMHLETISAEVERIGIIFPSYLAPVGGLPHIVFEFIKRIEEIETLSIFAICNCGGYRSVNALPSLLALQNAIKEAGGKCRATYSVRLPMNNLDYDHIPIPITKNSEEIIKKSKSTIDQICMRIETINRTQYPLLKSTFLWLMRPIFNLIAPLALKELRTKADVTSDSLLSVYELMSLSDKSIFVDKQCTGCGICAKVCPVNNIKLIDKKPVFQHECEVCFACDEWCPFEAIHHWSRTKHIKYHHPDITLQDMRNQ